jgi:hypothetical protein
MPEFRLTRALRFDKNNKIARLPENNTFMERNELRHFALIIPAKYASPRQVLKRITTLRTAKR